jgi:xylobiose transport system permease protein
MIRSASSGTDRTERGGLRQAGRPGFGWSVPAVAFFAFFALLPLAVAVYLSFTKYNGIRLVPPTFVGLDNWARLLTDAALHRSIGVTILLIVLAVATQVPVSLLIGVWAAGPQRLRAIVVSLYFIPLLMSTAAVAVLWASLADPNFGVPAVLNGILGPDNVFSNLLGKPATALGLIVFIYLWGATPLHTLLYQGGARAIPEVIYQAASIDGAGRVRQFFSITLPLLKNTIVTSTILMIVGTFTTFDLILILTRGGPSGGTSNLAFFMYDRGVTALDFGYGSVVAVLLIVLATAISVVMVRVTRYDDMQGTQEGI